MRTIPPIPGLIALSLLLASCAGGGTAPSPTLKPTPTPIVAPVSSPEEAAALVVASDPRFAGAIRLSSDVIGASKWWEAEAQADGSVVVKLTLGWGDCPAGCIERHTWTYHVAADGTLELVAETGNPLPSNL